MFFYLNIMIVFVGGKLFLKVIRSVYTDKEGWCSKAGIAIKRLLKVLHRQLGSAGGLSYIYGVVNGYNNKNK